MPSHRTFQCFALLLLILAPATVAGAEEDKAPFVLRLLPLKEGVRDTLNPKGDPKALRKTEVYLRARKVGIDLTKPTGDPVIAHGMRDGQLFYVFYKKLERAYGPRQWVLQRIKRTERNWKVLGEEPGTKVTYQVEAFKLFAGEQKRGDQHHGGYAIRDYAKREIVKEYEIGLADVPGLAHGNLWPFKKTRLFEYLVRYSPSREIYDQVRFTTSMRWTLRVRLDASGHYQVVAPELGLNVPAEQVSAKVTIPKPIASGKDLVLVPGVGLEGTRRGGGWFDRYVARAGPVLDERQLPGGNVNTILASGLMANRRQDGSLNTLQTRAGFAGRTNAGIAIGSSRWEVLKAYGQPRDARVAAAWWHYDRVGFWFDGLDRVGRFYVRRLKD